MSALLPSLGLLLAASALGGLGLFRFPLLLWGMAAIGLLMAAGQALLTRHPFLLPFPLTFYGGHLLVDPLSGWFLLLLALVMGMIALSAGSYLHHLPPRRLRLVLTVTPLFLFSMALVLTSDRMPTFLLAWEAMTITSYLLVIAGTDPQAEANGFIYLVMTHIGTGFLFLFFLLLSTTAGGHVSFVALASTGAHLPAIWRGMLGAVALIGLGMKMGLLPVHIWLPRAHPIAPAPVSALMSGVMLKMALYLLIRILLVWLSPLPLPFDGIVILLGLLTGLFGVLYAMSESDVKTFLAYSSMEQMGIATTLLGLAALATTLHESSLAALLLFALLLHALVHGLAKSGLFLTAGYLEAVAGTRNMDRMGGLWSRQGVMAVTFLTGAATLSALPPFPGFWVEWLLLQGGLHLGHVRSPLAVWVLLIVAALGMIGALAAAAFVKVFGLVFLGRSRAHSPPHPLPVPSALLLPALLIGLLSLLPGVLGQLILQVVPRADALARITPLGWSLGSSAISPVATLVLAIGLTFLAGYRFRQRRAPPVPLWACGGEATAAVQYSGPAYSKALRLILRVLFRPERSLVFEGSPLFPVRMRYEARLPLLFERHLYLPAVRRLRWLGRRMRILQSGDVRLYLTYLVGTLVLLLAFVW